MKPYDVESKNSHHVDKNDYATFCAGFLLELFLRRIFTKAFSNS